jgi:hypothetical protein
MKPPRNFGPSLPDLSYQTLNDDTFFGANGLVV